MLISDFRIHSIAMADPPLRSSYGLHQPYALRNVIELVSDDGVIGIAETYGGDQPAGALEAIRGKVIGACPYRLTGDLSPMVEGGASGLERSQTYNVPGENPLDADARTYSAIETACLDLIGKTVGKPVCDLIGGRVRDKVPFSAYPFYKHAGGGGEGDDLRDDEYGEALSPESLVAQVQQLRAKYGFGSIKFKGGVLDAGGRDRDTAPTPPGAWPSGAAADRSQLRLVGRDLREGRARLGRGTLRWRLP